MTIKKAREILGKRAETLTDEQISKLVNMLSLICSRAIDEAVAIKRSS